MSGTSPSPFDDTVQLVEVMPGNDFSDDVDPVLTRNGTESTASLPNMAGDDTNKKHKTPAPTISGKKAFIIVGTLLLVNLLNYMDRFTVAGVLDDVKKYYHNLSNSEGGAIQTAFICTFMVCSPIFGYLGDRYTRKYIMAGGIFLWSTLTLASSFVPADNFWLFILLRALVGIGEASYSTIAPTIIADLFAKQMRTKALMVFYFAIPVGSGLGYIVGSNVAKLLHNWKWALRVTPGFGILCVALILLFCEEPRRGQSEGGDVHLSTTSVCTDLKALIRNKSFFLSTIGATCVAFVTGALAFLAPDFMRNATIMQGSPESEATVGLIFGGITVAAGFLGVGLGAEVARRYRVINPRADPLICAFGLLASVPFLFFALVLSGTNTVATWLLIFVGEVFVCLNWAVTADILLYIVIPTRRSLAESVQILIMHAFGDAFSPYIIGQIADVLADKHVESNRPSVQFVAMQTALYLTTFVCVLGGACYLATAIFVERDRKRAEKLTHSHGDVCHFSDDGDDDDELLADGVDGSYITSDDPYNKVTNIQGEVSVQPYLIQAEDAVINSDGPPGRSNIV